MFSSQQISELLKVLERENLFFISSKLGADYLSEEEVHRLQSYGINPYHQYKESNDIAKMSFHFGLISDAIEQIESKKLTIDDLKEYFESGKHIPLTQIEKNTINSVKKQYLGDIKANNGKIFQDLNNIISKHEKNNRKAYEAVIRDEIAKGLLMKKTSGEIARELARKTGDWSRNFKRIVDFISHTAFDEGRAAWISDKYGEEALVAKNVYMGACKYCISAYLTAGIGSQPKIFKLSTLKANGSNIGRKLNELKPVIGSHHPNCFDKETEVLTNEGWKYFKDLNMEESFLSVNPETEESEWVKAVKKVEYYYEGVMHQLSGYTFNLLTTPNHNHLVKRQTSIKKYEKIRLTTYENLFSSEKFVRTGKNGFQGSDIDIVTIGNYSFNGVDFCQFMGWWLSEGSIVNCSSEGKKDRWQLGITQHKVQNREEIELLCKKMFPKVWCGKSTFSIPIDNKDQEFINYFKQFGKSHQKFIPNLIKESSRVYIETFLLSFRKGDGSSYKGQKNHLGGNFNDQDTFSTSSRRLADDIGELLLKLGDCPSFSITQPKAVTFKGGNIYTNKYPQICITRCKTKYSFSRRIIKTDVDYKDMVYDVELEKYHTLFVRRGGKVTVSGNCRCTLFSVDSQYDWNEKNQSFSEPKENPKPRKERPGRKPIRITVKGKEYLV